MQKFVYEYATKVYFGEGAAKEHLAAAVSGYGENVMLAYGGGSVKKNGIYDEVKKILEDAGKKVFDFNGIMSNPTYAKVQEGAKLAKENKIDFILAAGGGSVIDCCKIVAAQAKTDKDLWEMEMTDHQFPADAGQSVWPWRRQSDIEDDYRIMKILNMSLRSVYGSGQRQHWYFPSLHLRFKGLC